MLLNSLSFRVPSFVFLLTSCRITIIPKLSFLSDALKATGAETLRQRTNNRWGGHWGGEGYAGKKKEKSFEAPPRTRNSFLRPYSSHRKTKRRPRRKPRQNFSMPFAKASFDKWRKRSPNPNAAKIQPLIRRRSFIPAIYFEKFIGRPAIVIWRGNVFYSLHTYIMHLSLHI